jgi:hypothetical protein
MNIDCDAGYISCEDSQGNNDRVYCQPTQFVNWLAAGLLCEHALSQLRGSTGMQAEWCRDATTKMVLGDLENVKCGRRLCTRMAIVVAV